MRGTDTFTESLFTMRKLEDFVPADHPLRAIRKMANAALEKMNGLFAGMYEADIKGGRPSVAPEKLRKRCLCTVSTPAARMSRVGPTKSSGGAYFVNRSSEEEQS